MDGSQDALVIEQTDGSEDKSRKVSPAQIKQYVLNDMDEVPTQNSNNPVKSGGVYTALEAKQNTLTFDDVPTQNSNNPVKSSGIYSKIGDLTQTGITGDSVAAQLSDIKGQLDGKANSYVSTTNGTTQNFNVGAYTPNGCYLFSCGYASRYVLGLIAVSDNGNIAYSAIANGGGMTVTNKTFNRTTGDIQVVVSDNPYNYGRLTKVS